MVCVAPLCLETQLCTYVQTKSLAALSISFTYSLYLGHTRLPVTHPFSHPFKYTPCIETNNRWLQFPGQEACQFRREEEDKVGMEPGPSVSFPNVSKICPLLPDSSDDVVSRQNVFLNRLLNHPLLQISIQIVRSSCPLGQREEKEKKTMPNDFIILRIGSHGHATRLFLHLAKLVPFSRQSLFLPRYSSVYSRHHRSNKHTNRNGNWLDNVNANLHAF